MLLGLVFFDLGRPPARQLTARCLLAAIHLYQREVPVPTEGRCRMVPNCSSYAQAVIRRHGAGRGSWRTLRRIARCGPWTPVGTEDPP